MESSPIKLVIVVSAFLLTGLLFPAAPALAESEESPDAIKADLQELEQKEALTGHIKSEAAHSSTQLKELLGSLKQLGRSTSEIFGEVQREDLVVVGEPDVIGPMIVPAMPDVSGMLGTGQYLPARKKWIDYFMANIERLYPMVTKELEALKLPDDASDDMKEHYKRVVLAYNKLGPSLKDLEAVTQGPEYDNEAIARCATISRTYIEVMDKELKRLYRDMKKEVSVTKHDDQKLDRKIEKETKELERLEGEKSSD
ncbi:hypothetical protein GC174_08910 [bacterium]|nr:hypothetical protein [bacterium]